MPGTETPPLLRRLHRASAIGVGVFIILHLANHLAALGGQQAHIDFMKAIRPIYRNALIEPLLLAGFAWQLVSGFALLIRTWRTRRGLVAWAQAISGFVVLIFVVIHVGAVLTGRAAGVDTNFNFAAAGMHAGLSAFFVPYYFTAVVALFVHLACATYWNSGERKGLALGVAFTGVVLAATLVALLSGWIVEVYIPDIYLRSF
jgi:succinate dehydrogenase/fumarate reductase cytochrome b subunit